MTITTPEHDLAPLAGQTLDHYLDQLASSEPAPGGGAVVALLGAQAAALLAMAMRVSSAGAHGLEDAGREQILRHLDVKRADFLRLADADARAFTGVMNAYRMPKADDLGKKLREAAVQTAFKEATRVPLATLVELAQLFDVTEAVAVAAKANVASDVGVALQLLSAGLKASRYNLWINLKYIKDAEFCSDIRRSAARVNTGKRARRQALHQRLKSIIKS